jgi:hypothetical protein
MRAEVRRSAIDFLTFGNYIIAMATVMRPETAVTALDPIAEFEALAANVRAALAAEHRAQSRLMTTLAKAQAEGERQRNLLAR